MFTRWVDKLTGPAITIKFSFDMAWTCGHYLAKLPTCRVGWHLERRVPFIFDIWAHYP